MGPLLGQCNKKKHFLLMSVWTLLLVLPHFLLDLVSEDKKGFQSLNALNKSNQILYFVVSSLCVFECVLQEISVHSVFSHHLHFLCQAMLFFFKSATRNNFVPHGLSKTLTRLKESTICTSALPEHESDSLFSVLSMNGTPHLQAALTLGPNGPSCCAKKPLALESSLLNRVLSQHVRQMCIVTMRARTKWKHAGDKLCLAPRASIQPLCTFVDLTVVSFIVQ